MKNACIFALSAVVTVYAAIFAGAALADPVEQFKADYRAGKALIHRSDYQALYARTKERNLDIVVIKAYDDYLVAVYRADVDGTLTHGVISLDIADGAVTDEITHIVYLGELSGRALDVVRDVGDFVSLSSLGQIADAVTTAGMVHGLGSEINPITAPLTDSAGGLVALTVLKYGLSEYTKTQHFRQCVPDQEFINRYGWNATLWNIGNLASPVVGAIIAVIGNTLMKESTLESAIYECLK